jgi:glycosyltransferase involved in cell wall biosynthesis
MDPALRREADRVKLCFVCYEYPPGLHGGVGTFTQILGRALVRAGHQVRVAGVYPASYDAPDYEVDEGVQVWRLREGTHRLAWVRARVQLFRLIRGWVRRREIDLVEAPDCYGYFAGWPRMPVPLILRAHGALSYYAHELGQPIEAMSYRLESWGHRRADGWSAVSRHAGQVTVEVFRLARGPDRILYNPVTIPATATPFGARPPGRVVYTGTLTPKKGIGSLMQAWPGILRQHPRASLHVYGKGRAAGARSTADELRDGLPPEARASVVFHGHVPHAAVLQALADAHVAVFPSHTETFGFCAAEAMAAGCPTVYTTLSCGPEIVRHEVDGLLADPRDPSAIAAAVGRLLDDPELACRLGQAGRARVRRDFSLEALVPENERFFADMIDALRTPRRTGA